MHCPCADLKCGSKRSRPKEILIAVSACFCACEVSFLECHQHCTEGVQWKYQTELKEALQKTLLYGLWDEQIADDLQSGPLLRFDIGMQGEWVQLAMLQSMENGELAFLHRTATGAKKGRDGEDNPLRRWWPDYITTPVTRHIGPRIIGFNEQLDVVSVDKNSFDQDTFKCTSHASGLGSNSRPTARASSVFRARNFLSSIARRHSVESLELPLPSKMVSSMADKTAKYAAASPPSPLDERHETICPWDGTLSISKTDFTLENGMRSALEVVRAFENAYDSVLWNISAYRE